MKTKTEPTGATGATAEIDEGPCAHDLALTGAGIWTCDECGRTIRQHFEPADMPHVFRCTTEEVVIVPRDRALDAADAAAIGRAATAIRAALEPSVTPMRMMVCLTSITDDDLARLKRLAGQP